MEELNYVIYDCLNPDAQQRPTIESLLNRKVFAETTNMQLYKNLLTNHIDATQFYANIIEPVTSNLVSYSKKTNMNTILMSLKKLEAGIDLLINCRQIGS